MKIKTNEVDSKLINEISKKFKINKHAAHLLLSRGFSEDIIELLISKAPLEERVTELYNIERACNEIKSYLVSSDKTDIYIFGDYDSDGVNATYIMYTALKDIACENCTVHYYIPEREEGYGLSMDFCKDVVKNKDKETLVITVDNGIAKKEEVKYLQQHHIRTLVTDHHIGKINTLPPCTIVDSCIYNGNEPNKTGLCGAAVAYKIVKHLYTTLGYDEIYLDKFKPHVAIATITDMMPVTEENIILIKNGLKLINDYPYKDMEYSPVNESMYYFAEFNAGDIITPKDIAFGLGPQINSCGRLGDIQVAIKFMLSENEEEIEELYNEILNMNDERKELNRTLVDSIEAPKQDEFALIRYNRELKGLAGNVANNVMNKYNIPVVVLLTGDGKDVVGGSARCIAGYDLQEMLRKEKELGHIEDFGGHECACGLTIKKDMIDKFKESMNMQILSMPMPTEIDTTIYVDRIVETKEITQRTVNDYKDIMFFNDFKKPILYVENLKIDSVSYSKSNKNNIHFFFVDEKTGRKYNAWCWGYTDTYESLGCPDRINMVFSLEKFKTMLTLDIYTMEAA